MGLKQYSRVAITVWRLSKRKFGNLENDTAKVNVFNYTFAGQHGTVSKKHKREPVYSLPEVDAACLVWNQYQGPKGKQE